jgi:hypothetical protein
MGQHSISQQLRLPAKGDTPGPLRIVVDGLDQAGQSYEVRIFVNNPDARPDTALDPTAGYVGSIHVYGYGVWPADAALPASRPKADGRARAPMTRSVEAADAVLGAAEQGGEIVVTLVPVYPGTSDSAMDVFTVGEIHLDAAA